MKHLHERPAVVLAGVVLALVALAGMITIARLSTVQEDDDAATQPLADNTPLAVATRPPAAATTTSAADAPIADKLLAPTTVTDRLCRTPSWSDDAHGVETFALVTLGCLNAAWQPVVEGLNISFRPAKLQLGADPLPSNCLRPDEPTSFYCSGTIYLVESSFRATNTGKSGVPAAAESMLAHEFGHHLQYLAGTLQDSTSRIAAVGADSDAGRELTRRVELQAQCFAGIFMGASTDGDTLDFARRDSYTRGDTAGGPRVHGTPQNYGDWFTQGAVRNSLDACDTWTAAPNSVA